MRLTLLAVVAAAAASSGSVYARPAAIAFVPGQYSYAGPAAPLTSAGSTGSFNVQEVQDSYMVILKNGLPATAFAAHQQLIAGAQQTANQFRTADADAASHDGIRHIYDLESHLTGYAGSFSPDVLAYIRAQPEVAYVERDSIVHAAMLPDDGANIWPRARADTGKAHFTEAEDPHSLQKGAPWGLARISHREELGFGNFNKYVYANTSGDGVTAYIIDTGVYINHTEFEGRARWGKTIPTTSPDLDDQGHGSHCAGTIGSRKYGVAKKVELVAVKVLGAGGSGTMADVTAGVLWAVADAKNISATLALSPNSEKAKKHKGFVANMSLGGGKSPTLDTAVNGAVDNGLHFAVAAGNENQDACNTSPASAGNPVTVGASTLGDDRAYFSNFGKCVDIFAPGLNIKSVWNTGKDATNTISGTSMATPHIVGLLAYYLSIYGTSDFAKIADATPVPTLADLAAELRRGTASRSSWLASLARSTHGLLTALPLPSAGVAALDLALSTVAGDDDVVVAAPVPGKNKVITVLAPKDLKKALAGIATKNVLADLDRQSPNLLAFNNATSPSHLH